MPKGAPGASRVYAGGRASDARRRSVSRTPTGRVPNAPRLTAPAVTWERTFMDAMHSYRRAVLAWAQSIRVFTTVRQYTNQKKRVPTDTLEKFNKLVTFSDHGTAFTLTPGFKREIVKAEQAAAHKAGRGGGT
jgi:hypothetical protein